MVQKSRPAKRAVRPAQDSARATAKKTRGRPRAYEPEVALGKALDLFRQSGFAATSLDDLSAATGMNRPSLYGAFGDKRELYLKSLQRYRDDYRAALQGILAADLPIRERLHRIYAGALDIYLSGADGPRGCFSAMSVASEAIADPEIRAMALEAFAGLDQAFLSCFKRAVARGELPDSVDLKSRAQLASATIHSIALRARAGVPHKELHAIVSGAIDLICGG